MLALGMMVCVAMMSVGVAAKSTWADGVIVFGLGTFLILVVAALADYLEGKKR